MTPFDTSKRGDLLVDYFVRHLANHVDDEEILTYAFAPSELDESRLEQIELHFAVCAECKQKCVQAESSFNEAQLSREMPDYGPRSETTRPRLLSYRTEVANFLQEFDNDRDRDPIKREEVSNSKEAAPDAVTLHAADQHMYEKLINEFFKGWWPLEGTVKIRLCHETAAKMALGAVCRDLMLAAHNKKVFFECGSTTALAFLAMCQLWRTNGGPPRSLRVKTNNLFVQVGMYGNEQVETRLLYGDKFANQKYAGYLPVADRIIRKAMQGDERCKKRVWKAWKQLLKTSHKFSRLFMTASKFHMFVGPFVGSVDNALLKTAFFAGGKRVAILLDGTKLLSDAEVVAEWQFVNCIQVFDKLGRTPAEQTLRILVGEGVDESCINEKTASASRNPCAVLNLLGRSIPIESKKFLHFETPASWSQCVQNTLNRGGEVTLFVSEPDEGTDGYCSFAEKIRSVVKSANGFFEECGSRVRIAEPERSVAKIDPEKCSLVEASASGEVRAVWNCRYTLEGADSFLEPTSEYNATNPILN